MSLDVVLVGPRPPGLSAPTRRACHLADSRAVTKVACGATKPRSGSKDRLSLLTVPTGASRLDDSPAHSYNERAIQTSAGSEARLRMTT